MTIFSLIVCRILGTYCTFSFSFTCCLLFLGCVGEGLASFDDGVTMYMRGLSSNVLVGQVWRRIGGGVPFQLFGEIILIRKVKDV